MANFGTVIILTTLITRPVSSAPFCPIGCSCVDDSTQIPFVVCDGADLSNIPILFNPRINRLILSKNRISSVSLDDLGFYSDLTHLDLSGNKILSLERGSFYRLQKLRTLHLNGNLLSSLSIETFSGLSELRVLDLSDNGLRRLTASAFSDLRRLEILNISKNSITHISPGALTGLASLKRLYLQRNELALIPVIALRPLHSLHTLDLSHNRLEKIEDNSFSSLKELESLNVGFNLLESIDERAFNGLRSLRSLNLDSSRLRRVPTISFRLLTDLRSLSFSENQLISELPTSAFEGLPLLRQLIISKCLRLKKIDVNAFSGLSNLETLILTENRQLSIIDPMAFEFDYFDYESSPLRRVSMYGNNLSTLPKSLLPWSRLQSLDLRWNPWRCDCQFGSWIGDVLIKIYADRSFPDGAQCSGPENLRGRDLHELSTDQSGKIDFGDCDSPSWSSTNLITIGVAIAALIAITILVVLGIKCRRKLICYRFCSSSSSYGGVAPLRCRYAQPPGLPELCRYTKPVPKMETPYPNDQDTYAVRRFLADRRKIAGIDYYENQYEDAENQYSSTSGYYSNLTPDNGNLISDNVSKRSPCNSSQNSFRVLQKFPVPVTEL